MTIPTREPFLAYVRGRATILRQPRATAPAAAERLEAHAHALDLLAELVHALPEDDERILMLCALAVRSGQFAAGAGTEHALNQFDSTSREACDAFLTNLVRIARDDALTSARAPRASATPTPTLSAQVFIHFDPRRREPRSCATAPHHQALEQRRAGSAAHQEHALESTAAAEPLRRRRAT